MVNNNTLTCNMQMLGYCTKYSHKIKISVGYLWHYEALGRISVGKHYKAGYIICRESSFECGTQTGRQGKGLTYKANGVDASGGMFSPAPLKSADVW